jgi:hypothetical protein
MPFARRPYGGVGKGLQLCLSPLRLDLAREL